MYSIIMQLQTSVLILIQVNTWFVEIAFLKGCPLWHKKLAAWYGIIGTLYDWLNLFTSFIRYVVVVGGEFILMVDVTIEMMCIID